jgi:hypothetical protein
MKRIKHSRNKSWISTKYLYGIASIIIAMLVYFLTPKITHYYELLKWEYYTWMKLSKPISDKYHLSFTPLEIVNWDHSSKMVSSIVDKKHPCVIVNGPASSWSLDRWDFFNLNTAQSELVLENARWQREHLFILGREREKGGMLGSAHDRPLIYTNVSIDGFLMSVFEPKSFYYWTGQLSLFSDLARSNSKDLGKSENALSKIYKHRRDWKVFNVLENDLISSIEKDDEDIYDPTIWFSHPGVVSQTHYDTQHNFFTQILGVKRFTLFPPATHQYYVYPNIHRSFRQSQVVLEDDTKYKSFPDIQNSTAYQVDLKPGQTLYIPPYWYKHSCNIAVLY